MHHFNLLKNALVHFTNTSTDKKKTLTAQQKIWLYGTSVKTSASNKEGCSRDFFEIFSKSSLKTFAPRRSPCSVHEIFNHPKCISGYYKE
jgi:hypothetical protein